MSDDILEDIWAKARRELEDDYVGLWELVRRVRRHLPDLDDRQVQDAVLLMVDGGLRRGEARAGRGAVVGGLECVWTNPVNEITDRIRREWSELGRDPMPGEVVWLDEVRLDPTLQAAVISNPTKTYTQRNGAQVFVQQVGDRYNVVMERERGGHGNWKSVSNAILNRLIQNLGWMPN